MTETKDMGYVKMPDGAYIAYMTTGEGPIDVVWQPEIYSNIDVVWQMPRWAVVPGSRDFPSFDPA